MRRIYRKEYVKCFFPTKAFTKHSHSTNEFDSFLANNPRLDTSGSLASSHSNHDSNIHKGLAVVLGVYVFFFIESLMQIKQAKKIKVKFSN